MLGVLNLRGSIVPIVDLRMRFSLPRAEYTPLTVIIVLSLESPQGRRDCGLVVDGVSDVIDVPAADVKPAPDLGRQVSTEFIAGLAAVSGRMVMLLDIDRLIGGGVAGGTSLPVAANARDRLPPDGLVRCRPRRCRNRVHPSSSGGERRATC